MGMWGNISAKLSDRDAVKSGSILLKNERRLADISNFLTICCLSLQLVLLGAVLICHHLSAT